jgi:TRAP-type transport system small permease protein
LKQDETQGVYWTALHGLGRRARSAIDYIGAALFFVTFLCFVLQVMFRYFFNAPQAWTDEAAVVLFVILACWSSALMTSWREHVTLDVLVTSVPARIGRIMRITALVALVALFVSAIPSAVDLTIYMARRVTPVLDINMSVLAGAFVLFLVGFAVRAVAWILRLVRTGE